MKLWLKIPIALLSTGALAASAYLSLGSSPVLVAEKPGPVTVGTTPLPLTIYCPGPLAELGGEDGTDLGSLALIGKSKIWSSNTAAQLAAPIPEEIEAGSVISLLSKEQTTAAISANQTQVVDRQRMVGIAAANCSKPLTKGTFATGMASVGRESILFLANPFENEVQVYLEIALTSGTKTHLVTLAGFEQQQISLAAFVEAEPNFALSFTTNGPPVSATMQLRTSSGLTATGVDIVPATQVSNQIWIPGLAVFEDSYQAPSLRLFNPNADQATARVTFIGVGNDSDVFETTIEPGQVLNLDLDLPVGEYLVHIESEIPLGSAIWSQRLGETLDFTWLVPAEEFAGSLFIPVPQLESELVIANPASNPITVAMQNAGSYTSLTIPAESQVRTRVQYSLVELQSNDAFLATLQIVSKAGYAVITPTENENLGSDLEIFVR